MNAHSDAASWIELRADALRQNISVFRSLLGGSRLGAVLKANAYGHGFLEVLSVVHGRIDCVYVIAPHDGLRVREFERNSGATKRQVLVLGATSADEVVELARNDVDVVISDAGWISAATALRAAKLDRKARVHIHLDTGLGREGFSASELPELCAKLREAQDVIEVAGVLSHFSNTEDVTEQEYALSQIDVFDRGWEQLRTGLGLAAIERHFAASAAAMVLPQSRYDIVRLGIALYGLWPSKETRLSARVVLKEVPALQPALSLKCRSQAIKLLPAGAFVGYGCTYRCSQATRVAVLPIGYFDGYPRALSSRAHVLVNGARCPVLGRVMMNHVVVDISRVEGAGESVVATLLGSDGADQVSTDQLAEWAQTINYEIVARLGPHLRRELI